MAEFWFPSRLRFNERTDLPVHGGGELRVNPGSVDVKSRFARFVRDDDERVFVNVATKFADAKGQIWLCEELVDPYEFYEQVVTGTCYAKDQAIGRLRENSQRIDGFHFSSLPILEPLLSHRSTGSPRLFKVLLQKSTRSDDLDETKSIVFDTNESQWAFKLSLVVVYSGRQKNASFANPSLYARVEMVSDQQSLVVLRNRGIVGIGDVDLVSLNPLNGLIYLPSLLLRDRWFYFQGKDEAFWDARRYDRPPLFRVTGETGEPNKNVRHEP